MVRPATRGLLLATLTTLLVAGVLAARAEAAELRGVVIDAATDLPVAGAIVRTASSPPTFTDAQGRYVVDVGESDLPATLEVWTHTSDEALRYVDQTPDHAAVLRVLPASIAVAPSPGAWWGLPRTTSLETSIAADLEDLVVADPLRYTVGPALPTHIRVGRRFASSCSGNPVTRIDTVALEDYVEGVLVPEIGVFKSIAGGPDSALAVFKAFAVAARSYAVWFYLRDPDAEYHIDDTACNQRYDDARDAFIRRAVDETAGMILVARSDANLLDKLEYAASCGRHGSLPEYQTTLVPDVTGVVACVGSWCGHNGCAGHEVNPAVPDGGRCLVRGICQWGAAERSMRGDDFSAILSHYQPNLQTRTVGAEPLPTQLVGYVRVGDIAAGPPVAGVTVSLDTGASTTTNEAGYFAFADVDAGLRVVSYSGGGIVPASREKLVEPGITNWASQAVSLEPLPADPEPDAGGIDVGTPDADPPDVGVPDSAAPDGGSPADALDALPDPADAADVAATDVPSPDGGATPDTAPTPDATDSGRPTLLDAEDAPPRALSIVGPEGLGNTGLGCTAATPSLPLLAAAPLLLLRRRRRS